MTNKTVFFFSPKAYSIPKPRLKYPALTLSKKTYPPPVSRKGAKRSVLNNVFKLYFKLASVAKYESFAAVRFPYCEIVLREKIKPNEKPLPR